VVELKIQKGKCTLYVNLPIEYCRLLGWGKGTELACYPSDSEKRVMILKEVPRLKQQMEA